jgi:hypothetical protein
MSTLEYVSAADVFRGVRFVEPSQPKAPVKRVPEVIRATPAWAWDLHHHRRVPLRKVASLLGVSLFDVLALLAEHKPFMDRAAFAVMKQDHGGREPIFRRSSGDDSDEPVRSDFWIGSKAAEMAATEAGFLVSSYVDVPAVGVAVLWLWPSDCSEDDIQEHAVGIEISACGDDLRLIDGYNKRIPTPRGSRDSLEDGRLAGRKLKEIWSS